MNHDLYEKAEVNRADAYSKDTAMMWIELAADPTVTAVIDIMPDDPLQLAVLFDFVGSSDRFAGIAYLWVRVLQLSLIYLFLQWIDENTFFVGVLHISEGEFQKGYDPADAGQVEEDQRNPEGTRLKRCSLLFDAILLILLADNLAHKV